MAQMLQTNADRLREFLEAEEDLDELKYHAATALAGPIRDTLRDLVAQVDAIHDVLDSRGVWDHR